MMVSKTRSHRDHLRRPWRIAFVSYALVLTTATHWPQLQLSPAVPATDTDLHFIAFALLTFLLARTRWIRPWWLVVLLTALWGVADESSQAIPILNRTISLRDGFSNVLGAVSMGVWLWAVRPGSHTRKALALCAFDRVFLRFTAWLVLAVILACCAIAPLLSWFFLEPEMTQVLILIAVSAAMIASTVVVALWWRRERARICEARLCFACGASNRSLEFDQHGRARCPACNEELHLTQWIIPCPPSTRIVLSRGFLLRIAVIYLAVIPTFGLLVGVSAYARSLQGTPAAETWHGRAAAFIASYRSTLAVPLIFAALFMRALSGRMEEVYRMFLCPRCGHDLRGTPTRQDIGHCGECGARFIITPARREQRARLQTRGDPPENAEGKE